MTIYDRKKRAKPFTDAFVAKRPRGRPRGKCNELGHADVPLLSGKRKRAAAAPEHVGSPSGFRDQRKDVRDILDRSRVRRSTNLGCALDTRMLARYALLRDGANGKKEGVKELADEFEVHRSHVTNDVIPRALDESRGKNPLAFSVENRCARIFTEEIDMFMVDKCIEWEGDFSWQEMATAVNREFSLPAGVPSAEGVRLHWPREAMITSATAPSDRVCYGMVVEFCRRECMCSHFHMCLYL